MLSRSRRTDVLPFVLGLFLGTAGGLRAQTSCFPTMRLEPVTVQDGDTIGQLIVDQFFDVLSNRQAWEELSLWGPDGMARRVADENRLANPDLILPGDHLHLPDPASCDVPVSPGPVAEAPVIDSGDVTRVEEPEIPYQDGSKDPVVEPGPEPDPAGGGGDPAPDPVPRPTPDPGTPPSGGPVDPQERDPAVDTPKPRRAPDFRFFSMVKGALLGMTTSYFLRGKLSNLAMRSTLGKVGAIAIPLALIAGGALAGVLIHDRVTAPAARDREREWEQAHAPDPGPEPAPVEAPPGEDDPALAFDEELPIAPPTGP